MNKIFFILTITFILFGNACKEKNQSVEFDLKQSNKIDLSEIFEVSETIKIKNDKPIPPIKKLYKLEDYYVGFMGGNICKINNNGDLYSKLITKENKFLFKGITSIDVFNNSFYTIERAIQSFKVFNNNFELAKEYKLPFYVLAFRVISDSTVLFYLGFQSDPTFNTQLVLYDLKEEKVSNTYLPVPTNLQYFNIFNTDNIILEHNKYYFFNGMDNTLYKFEGNSLSPEICFNYGIHSLPQDFYKTSDFEDVQKYTEHVEPLSKVSKFYNLRKSNNYIIKRIHIGKERLHVFKNMTTNKEFSSTSVNDDITNSGIINSWDEETAFLGVIGDKFGIYIENAKLDTDSTFVGTILLGNFKF